MIELHRKVIIFASVFISLPQLTLANLIIMWKNNYNFKVNFL